MNRIGATFQALTSARKKALIPYTTPEFPFKGMTLGLLQALDRAGADMIEVGIPFSDPLADGETIQRASEQALRNGVRLDVILDAVREFRKQSERPVILMGYFNPIMQSGLDRFCAMCAAAGVDGVIVPDLPPEESNDFRMACTLQKLSNVFLIAPTSSDERIRSIDQFSSDFSYCVSVTGVTGARTKFGEGSELDDFLVRVQNNTKKPFVVGFGISRAEHVKHVWRYADGAVVGSSLLNALATAGSAEAALRTAGEFLRSLRPS